MPWHLSSPPRHRRSRFHYHKQECRWRWGALGLPALFRMVALRWLGSQLEARWGWRRLWRIRIWICSRWWSRLTVLVQLHRFKGSWVLGRVHRPVVENKLQKSQFNQIIPRLKINSCNLQMRKRLSIIWKHSRMKLQIPWQLRPMQSWLRTSKHCLRYWKPNKMSRIHKWRKLWQASRQVRSLVRALTGTKNLRKVSRQLHKCHKLKFRLTDSKIKLVIHSINTNKLSNSVKL